MDIQNKLVDPKPFQVGRYGGLEAWADFVLLHPKFGKVLGKQFLGAELGLSSMEVSLNSLAPGKGVPFLHAHRQNEELYFFLAGKGQMLLDAEVVEVDCRDCHSCLAKGDAFLAQHRQSATRLFMYPSQGGVAIAGDHGRWIRCRCESSLA